MRTLLLFLLSFAALPSSLSAATIATTFAGGNNNEGNMFDVQNISGGAVMLTGVFEGNFSTSGVAQVWYRAGSYVGHELDQTGWTLLGTAGYVSAGNNVPTLYDVGASLVVAPGQVYGFLFVSSDESQAVSYTNGSNVYSDGVLSISTGVGIDWESAGGGVPPINTSSFNANRSWNGSIEYDAVSGVPEPTTWTLMLGGVLALSAMRRRRS